MTRSCINSIFGYAPAVALFNRPSYSSAMSAFNDGFKSLRCPTRTVASGGWMVRREQLAQLLAGDLLGQRPELLDRAAAVPVRAGPRPAEREGRLVPDALA